MSSYAPEELLACAIARLIGDAAHVAVGAASPIPASACELLRARSGGRPRLSLMHQRTANPYTEGSRELFDLAGQGRVDVFFLGGAQIDGEANINLVATGEYPKTDARFPGSFGSGFMYFASKRTILFREEHSKRVLVPKVDFISAPGWSPPEVWRRGGPQALVTGRAIFAWDKDAAGVLFPEQDCSMRSKIHEGGAEGPRKAPPFRLHEVDVRLAVDLRAAEEEDVDAPLAREVEELARAFGEGVCRSPLL